MRHGFTLLSVLAAFGCTTLRVHTVPPARAAQYLDGIAKAKVDECGVTYALLNEYGDAAIPVVVRALDLYSVPTNAPSGRCRVLNGVGWCYRLNGEKVVNIVDQIMSAASQSPNPDISRRGRKWIEWRKSETQTEAEQAVAPYR